MPLSMHQASVPVFVQGLTACSGILGKAAAEAERRQLDPAVLLADRLAPDMFPLARQVQVAADFAKNTVARLAGIEVPRFEDTETSIPELQERLSRTVAFVRGVDPASVDGSEEREIVLPIGGRTMTFTGQPYLLRFALPNFFFHLTAAYAILRHRGIQIGKRDFIGEF
jgi:uncharacterized protein